MLRDEQAVAAFEIAAGNHSGISPEPQDLSQKILPQALEATLSDLRASLYAPDASRTIWSRAFETKLQNYMNALLDAPPESGGGAEAAIRQGLILEEKIVSVAWRASCATGAVEPAPLSPEERCTRLPSAALDGAFKAYERLDPAARWNSCEHTSGLCEAREARLSFEREHAARQRLLKAFPVSVPK